jgi:rare lipoprotein A
VKSAAVLLAIMTAVLLLGCGAKHPVTARIPAPPPPIAPEPAPSTTQPPTTQPPPTQPPVYAETGLASWYGPPYHNRQASNGEVYDMNAMTAAHRTLPLGTIVRVTNVQTGHSAVVRINDRGPFVEGRIIDLSLAAAKAVDVWRPGTAMVRLEVLSSPAPIDTGGRWCVQIGALADEDAADELKDQLEQRYHTAHVLDFVSPVGTWWVRVRVAQDDRHRAEEVARETHSEEGSVFLVRLD